MKRTLLLCAVAALLLPLFPILVPAQTAEDAARDVEAAFRSLMEAWAYGQYWKMWEMGTNASRVMLPQNDFSARMSRRGVKPAAGKQVETIAVSVRSPEIASVSVRFTLENAKQQPMQFSREFTATFQHGAWRFDIAALMNLAHSVPSVVTR